jgi:hypothetical protein
MGDYYYPEKKCSLIVMRYFMKKFIFWALFTIIGVAASILLTYIYGYFHNIRYWQTINAVQHIEIHAIKGILQLDINKMIASNDFNIFTNIFKDYYGKLNIKIVYNDRVVFQNIDKSREIGSIDEKIDVNNKYGNLVVLITNYKAPPWNKTFFEWINPTNIPKWFSPKINYLTLSFFSFLFLSVFASFAFWLAFVMSYKAHHESKLLRNLMEELDFEK